MPLNHHWIRLKHHWFTRGYIDYQRVYCFSIRHFFQAPSTSCDESPPPLPMPEELSQLQTAVLSAICQLHTPQIAFGGELEAGVIADETLVEMLEGAVLLCGYGSIPIHTIFRGMNIHLPAILMFTRGTRFWHTVMFLAFIWPLPSGYD